MTYLYANEGYGLMAPYKHQLDTHQRAVRARRLRKIAVILALFTLALILYVGIDWLLAKLNKSTVVSVETNATVQASQIYIFQTPYFRFQADDSWKEVTEEIGDNTTDRAKQYLYRSFNSKFIEREIWIGVNLPDNYILARHNIPTRVLPIDVEADGTITQLEPVSEQCDEVLDKENPNLEPHIVKQKDVEYFCDPNNQFYTVTLGQVGATNRLKMPRVSDQEEFTLTVIYRDVNAIPSSRQFETILETFRSL